MASFMEEEEGERAFGEGETGIVKGCRPVALNDTGEGRDTVLLRSQLYATFPLSNINELVVVPNK